MAWQIRPSGAFQFRRNLRIPGNLIGPLGLGIGPYQVLYLYRITYYKETRM